ncbi:MAG: lytic transglycosylase domain-containing protein, partial [Lentisphaerae bacterium]|nr:lytic transglycosylase domain-containing protein [Lentisphaerota bacterium]
PSPPPGKRLEQARNRYVESRDVWVRKLSNRPPPERAAALLPSLKQIFREEGIPPQLVWQAEAESTFNPAARSPAGAVGLFQFMPATAKEYGLSLTPADDRLDAQKSARAAARYLKYLHNRFGSWPLALAAYNCGQGRVAKTLRETNGKTLDDIHDRLPAETRMYVPKIAALIQLRENANLDHL